MKKWAILFSVLLLLPSVSAMHNRFATGWNGNYLPMQEYVNTRVYNTAYPDHYGFDLSGMSYNARYCGKQMIGQSEFGIMDHGRCTMRYGRYGKFGLAYAEPIFLTTSAALMKPHMMKHKTMQGFSGRDGKMSRFYP